MHKSINNSFFSVFLYRDPKSSLPPPEVSDETIHVPGKVSVIALPTPPANRRYPNQGSHPQVRSANLISKL